MSDWQQGKKNVLGVLAVCVAGVALAACTSKIPPSPGWYGGPYPLRDEAGALKAIGSLEGGSWSQGSQSYPAQDGSMSMLSQEQFVSTINANGSERQVYKFVIREMGELRMALYSQGQSAQHVELLLAQDIPGTGYFGKHWRAANVAYAGEVVVDPASCTYAINPKSDTYHTNRDWNGWLKWRKEIIEDLDKVAYKFSTVVGVYPASIMSITGETYEDYKPAGETKLPLGSCS